jgi:hypothetical protein
MTLKHTSTAKPFHSTKDWTGNKNSIYKTLGASNHTKEQRQNEDFYATEPKAAQILLNLETFNHNIWECACGQGHLSNVLQNAGYNVKSTDLIDRNYGHIQDFLAIDNTHFNGDIITNPPYKYAQEFVEKALQIIPIGNKIAMFLKLQFLEGKKRKILFMQHPPQTVYVSSSRLLCAKNAEFDKMIAGGGSAVAYAWFVWKNGFKGNTTLKWCN